MTVGGGPSETGLGGWWKSRRGPCEEGLRGDPAVRVGMGQRDGLGVGVGEHQDQE